MGAMETMNAGNLHFHEKHLQWYALLEGAHPTYNTLDLVYKNIAIPEWAAIYQFAPYEALAKVSPVLVKLDQPRKWLQQWQQSFPGLAGSMLGSDSGLETVVGHLRTLVSVRVEGGVDSLFRFHDSWIASALYPTLRIQSGSGFMDRFVNGFGPGVGRFIGQNGQEKCQRKIGH